MSLNQVFASCVAGVVDCEDTGGVSSYAPWLIVAVMAVLLLLVAARFRHRK